LCNVRIAIFGSEEDFLWRRLVADIDGEASPEIIDRQRGQRSKNSAQSQQREIAQPIAALASRHATAGHTEKAGE
jgi:hypothetical protein